MSHYAREERRDLRRARVARTRFLQKFALFVLLLVSALAILHSAKANRKSYTPAPASMPSPVPTSTVQNNYLPAISPFPSRGNGADLRARLEYLVRENPDREVKEGIMLHSVQHNLKMVTEYNHGQLASFGVEERDEPGITDDELGHRHLVGALFIDAESLAQVTTREEMLGFMAVIGHEYQHFKEWRVAPPDQWDDWRAHSFGSPMKPDQCRRQFEGELVGYAYECRMCRSWGIESAGTLRDVCRSLDAPVEFRDRLLAFLAGNAPGASNPECIPIWGTVRYRPSLR